MSDKVAIICLHCGEIIKSNSPRKVICKICKGIQFHRFDEIDEWQDPIEYASSIRRDFVELGLHA